MATRFSAAAGAYTIAPNPFRWLNPPISLDILLLLPTLERLPAGLVGLDRSLCCSSMLREDENGDDAADDEATDDDVPSAISNELANADMDK